MKENWKNQWIMPLWQNSTVKFVAVLALPVLLLCAILADGYQEGATIFDVMASFTEWMAHPSIIRWNSYTIKFMGVGIFCYAFAVALYISSRENRRPGEEYGSAKWGNPYRVCQKYKDHTNPRENIILTQNLMIGMNGSITKRNINILVVGGSGAGKSRFICKPQIMSANASYIITDPKGELARDVAQLLKEEGYVVKIFNLIEPDQSDSYNPFAYLHDEKDVLKLIDNLIKNTTPKNSSSADPFWEKSEIALDSALMLYLLYEAPKEEQNFATMMYMMEHAQVKEEQEDYKSPLDLLFESLEEEKPYHPAVKQYKVFKQAAGKTAKSILISAAVRLAAFNLPQYARMTARDDMELDQLGERKQAIFCIIPVTDTSMNYLVGMLYTQCFQELYRIADDKYQGRLPRTVQVIQDEWANVAQPDSFPRILATCRSYNIGIEIVVQNIASIKALYKDDWEGIIGNCDSFVYLGGNEQGTHEYLSKMLGKETLDTRTRGVTKGHSGSSSTNYQQTGRELLTMDEVRMLDNSEALVFIRGERPVKDKKYDVTKHPNANRTTIGGAPPYVHHRKLPDYTLQDLPYEIENLNDIVFLEE